MKNYYFKFQKGNKGFDLFFSSKEYYSEALGLQKNKKEFPLSIYFGMWKSDEYEKGIEIVKEYHKSSLNGFHKSKAQIKCFYDIPKNKEKTYFWSFYNDIVICFKPKDLTICDGPEYLNIKKESLPKSINCIIHKVYKKIDLPEVFSNINANQKYNRGTIRELENSEKIIADHILSNKKIDITYKNLLEYLSPMEFETLLFLIFNNVKDELLCSSYRGGTLKDYDLRIKAKKDFHGVKKGSHWIQVKLKKESIKLKHGYYAYLGTSDFDKNYIGRDWLIDRIKERPDIIKWLNEMVFDYNVFTINF
jgi:hypothetical protein